MKTNKPFFCFGAILLLIISFSACTINKAPVPVAQEPITAFRLGLTKLNVDDQKLIFDNMPADIKSALWKDRLDEALTMPLTEAQKALVQEIRTQISPSIYDSAGSMEFKTYAVKWYAEATSAFKGADSSKLISIFMQLGDPNETVHYVTEQGNLPDCDCVLAGAWGNCPLNFTCKPKPCTANRCGIFWAWYCDALCKYDY